MQEYTYQKEINAQKLNKEIVESLLPSPEKILYSDGFCYLYYPTALSSQDQATLDAIITAHVISDPTCDSQKLIENAMELGRKLMINFAAENVLMGITQAGKTKAVLTYLNEVKQAMETGSLYVAISEIDELIVAGLPVELEPFITEARLLTFKATIEDFLGI